MTLRADRQFTRRRFQRFSEQKQHIFCAQLIQQGYTEGNPALPEIYTQYLSWMALTFATPSTHKEWANRFHYHCEMAELDVPEHHLLPSLRTGDREEAEPCWPIAIYLDNLRSPHNVGSIVRTTEAYSLGQLYLSPATPSIDHPKVEETAMGCADWVTAHTLQNFDQLPRPIIALETSDDAPDIHTFPFPESFTLAIGNEEYGLSDALLSVADAIVTIPLRGRKNSLNVANAFSIAAAEIARQRRSA